MVRVAENLVDFVPTTHGPIHTSALSQQSQSSTIVGMEETHHTTSSGGSRDAASVLRLSLPPGHGRSAVPSGGPPLPQSRNPMDASLNMFAINYRTRSSVGTFKNTVSYHDRVQL